MSATTTIIVMGVSGVGKSVIASAVADRLGWCLTDADDIHSAANIAAMKAGVPLTDTDRGPWLASITHWIDARESQHQNAVIACSALKRSYRDFLREGRGSVVFAHLDAPRDVLIGRHVGRSGHFMPVGLLQDQLDVLEPLDGTEPGAVIHSDQTVAQVAQDVIDGLVPQDREPG